MEQLINRIMFAMGLVDGDIPENVIDHFLNEWLTAFPSNECLALHNTIISLYEWLIRNAARDGSGGGSKKEKVGDYEVSTADFNKATDWQRAYDKYLDNPDSALPSCKGSLKSNGATIIIGGTNRDKVRDVNRSPDRFNQYDDRSPYRARTRIPTRNRAGFRFDEELDDDCD